MSANGHEESRMDRFERGLEHLLQSVARHDVQIAAIEDSLIKTLGAQRQLLTAQVVFVDETRKAFVEVAEAQRKSAEAQRKSAEAQRKSAEALRRTDEKIQELSGKIDALVGVVDGIVRRTQ